MLKRIVLGCGLLILVAVAGILVLLNSASREFKPLVLGILHLYNQNRIETIYEEASDQLRERMTEDVLRQDLEAIRRRLGEFKEAGTVTGGSRGCDSSEGSSGSLEVSLKFEKGDATGSFEFAQSENAWRLSRISIAASDSNTPSPSPAPQAAPP